jgi:hypothetical protein
VSDAKSRARRNGPVRRLVACIGSHVKGDTNVDWAWYAGGWNAALAGVPDAGDEYQFHHQPFVYFANYADGTPGRAAHLKDETDFVAAARSRASSSIAGALPRWGRGTRTRPT